MPMAGMEWARRRGPEAALALLAGTIFLGYLGALDLWGKREQRAAAETIDTVDHNRWLIAHIQGRKRLEKPPLPRWTTAALMTLTGRRDEWIVRLPGALAALGSIGLVYGLGRRLGGRTVGLVAGLALTSMVFFIIELRQAGNDGPLAFFTTLALYAAWRRLHGGPVAEEGTADPPTEPLGARRWAILMYAALGLGFLTKGPIILVLVAGALVPYLACAGRLRRGLTALVDGWGLAVLVLLALSWPVPVLIADPVAGQVWYLEMAQKAGSAGIKHHKHRHFLAADWPGMTAPWTIVAISAVLLPLLSRGRGYRPRIWFPWWWAMGNLAMFCLWKVAKPNYYLPCLPGVALLIGVECVRLIRTARGVTGASSTVARRLLQLHWVMFFTMAVAAPVAIAQVVPDGLGWALGTSVTLALGVLASAWAWRRGSDFGTILPLVAPLGLAILVVYGVVLPSFNPVRGHRDLAAQLDRLLPPSERRVMFYHDLDEGLWFYLRDRGLEPVPGSQPPYNDAMLMYQAYLEGNLVWDQAERLRKDEQVLLDWIGRPDREERYVLIRAKVYDIFAPRLEPLTRLLFREEGLERNEVVLLHVPPAPPVASGQSSPTPPTLR